MTSSPATAGHREVPGRRLSLAQARRIALVAQGLGRERPRAVTMRQVQASIDAVAQFQIDSVNVAVRAHLMPLFTRWGPYDTRLLERAAQEAPRRVFEYWGHAASLIDTSLEPALQHRMRAHAQRGSARIRDLRERRPDLEARVLAEVTERGPITASQIEDDMVRGRVTWGWNWSPVKVVLEHLFDIGVIAVAGRTPTFERRYDLAERVLPRTPELTGLGDADAHDMLVARAARALGIADARSLATYFYLKGPSVRAAIGRLTARGLLIPAHVKGLGVAHWMWHEASVPRSLHAQALVSPFDSLAYDRERLETIFGTRYRIEIYVPAAQRRHGYYVYLFWWGDVPAARVDLKADRGGGILIVRAAWREPGVADAAAVARALACELSSMASWLGLGAVMVEPRGDLAEALARAV